MRDTESKICCFFFLIFGAVLSLFFDACGSDCSQSCKGIRNRIQMPANDFNFSWACMQDVGCDYKLGSGTRLDRCKVCGGDGSSCALNIFNYTKHYHGYGEWMIISVITS